ncbi:MAG: hypothetical protein Q8K65_05700 [Alphaproteobacteria bacterium]|nr:hypothetical protein [Alphaproteobacteria bacterium]
MEKIKTLWQRLTWAITPPARKTAQRAAVFDVLKDIPETAALLDLAAAKGVSIDFDKSLIGKKTSGVFTRSTLPGKTCIKLKPGRAAGETAATLVHELRHLWQAEVLGLDGAKDLRGEYIDPATKILVTRIKEADAFAFTHYIASRVERMNRDLAELGDMLMTIKGDAPKLSLTDEDRARIDAHFREKHKDMQQQDVDIIRSRFLAELADLDGYDRRALRKYHALYTHPDFETKKKPPEDAVFQLSNLRRILRAGVGQDAPDYMADLDDAALAAKILAPIAADVKNAAGLITAFEKAAADSRLSPEEMLKAKQDIHKAVKDVTAQLRKKQLLKSTL